MVVIDDGDALARALDLPLDPRMAALLLERQRQLGADFGEHCRFVLVGPMDRPRWIEDACGGLSLFQNPADGTWFGDDDYSPGFDTIADHGFCYELTFDLTTEFTLVILVERAPRVHARIIELCETFASQNA
jgi:hypothetical protein